MRHDSDPSSRLDILIEAPNRSQVQTVETEVVASGGVGSAADLRVLAAFETEGTPLAGAIVGKALYDGALTIDDALAAAQAE